MADLQVKVYPEDDLDVSADFLHDVARWFANAHGSGIKLTYAEMLNKMLHPIVQVSVTRNDADQSLQRQRSIIPSGLKLSQSSISVQWQ